MNRELWRYARQVQVIGEPAQRAMLASRATVHARGAADGLGETLEALYLAGAGLGSLEAPAPIAAHAAALNGSIAVISAEPGLAGDDGTADPLLAGIADETARAAAAGAIRALTTCAKVIR